MKQDDMIDLGQFELLMIENLDGPPLLTVDQARLLSGLVGNLPSPDKSDGAAWNADNEAGWRACVRCVEAIIRVLALCGGPP